MSRSDGPQHRTNSPLAVQPHLKPLVPSVGEVDGVLEKGPDGSRLVTTRKEHGRSAGSIVLFPLEAGLETILLGGPDFDVASHVQLLVDDLDLNRVSARLNAKVGLEEIEVDLVHTGKSVRYFIKVKGKLVDRMGVEPTTKRSTGELHGPEIVL